MKTKHNLLLLTFLSLASPLAAHHSSDHAVTLHIDNTYKECSMALDPSITQQEFRDFAREAGPILYFKPLAGAKPLGKFNFDIGVEQTRTSPLEDYKGKWNNTFVHPTPDHYLVPDNHMLAIPLLHARMGITDKADIEAYITKSFGANYGLVGGAIKYAWLQSDDLSWASSARLTYAAIFGVSDFNYHQLGADLLFSRDIWFFRPYAGAGVSLGYLKATTDKVSLLPETAPGAIGIAGLQFVWKHLSLAVEADFGIINMYTFKLAVTF